uniref:O-acyltransferase WSD1 C-terminal domain-containing protein n=1 Tax=Timema cristinae TaxID=61476 RepID=A0A7R9GSP1_TIMCR|nr:unnamed protein product [Timema cristinae]
MFSKRDGNFFWTAEHKRTHLFPVTDKTRRLLPTCVHRVSRSTKRLHKTDHTLNATYDLRQFVASQMSHHAAFGVEMSKPFMCRSGDYLRSAPVRRLHHPLEESPIWGLLGSLLAAGLALVVGLPVLVIVCVLIPACLLARWFLLLVFWNRQTAQSGGGPESIRGNDGRWLGSAWRSSVIHAVLIFEAGAGLDVALLRHLLLTRVVPFWLPDSHFNIEKHVFPGPPLLTTEKQLQVRNTYFLGRPYSPRRNNFRGETRLPWAALAHHGETTSGEKHAFPGLLLLTTEKQLQVRNASSLDRSCSPRRNNFSGEDELKTLPPLKAWDYVGRLLMEGLPCDKPPWEMHVLQSYGKHADTVAVLRVHQSVADGMALVRVLCHSLTDCQILHVPQRPHFGALAFTVNLVRACLVGPLTLLFWLLLTDDCNLLTQRGSWTGQVTVTWSAAITLPKITRIKQVTRSTVNCVLLSALAGAARRLLQGCGVKQPRDMKVVLPVDLRSDITSNRVGSRLGSKVAPVVVGLPVSVEGAVPRLWATRRYLDSLRTSADPVVVYVATAALMSIIPGQLARRILSAVTGKASLQFASLPGPPSTLMVGGHPLKGVYPLLPAQSTLGLAVSVFTYADQVYVAVISDSALGPAASMLLHHLNSQVSDTGGERYLNSQIELLWKLLLHRRVPGESRSHYSIARPDVTGSPIRELQLRLCTVQKEVQRLTQSSQMETEAARLQHLKTEFSELLTELQRRHSLIGNSSPFFEDEEVNGELWRPRRRAMSCTSTRCSSQSLVRLLSAGRPASYIDTTSHSYSPSPATTHSQSPENSRHPSRSSSPISSRRSSQEIHQPSRRRSNTLSSHQEDYTEPPYSQETTLVKSKQNPMSSNKKSCLIRGGSRQLLNSSTPLAEEISEINEKCVQNVNNQGCIGMSHVHYTNECSEQSNELGGLHNGSIGRNLSSFTEDNSTATSNLLRSTDFIMEETCDRIPAIKHIKTCHTHSTYMVTEIECHTAKIDNVPLLKSTNQSDTQAFERSNELENKKSCEEMLLECTECQPLLFQDNKPIGPSEVTFDRKKGMSKHLLKSPTLNKRVVNCSFLSSVPKSPKKINPSNFRKCVDLPYPMQELECNSVQSNYFAQNITDLWNIDSGSSDDQKEEIIKCIYKDPSLSTNASSSGSSINDQHSTVIFQEETRRILPAGLADSNIPLSVSPPLPSP